MPAVHWHSKTSYTPKSACAELSGHGVHAELRCPGMSKSCHVDAGQGTHADIPGLRATLPLAHAWHVLLLEAAMLADDLPAAQVLQTEALLVSEKVPAPQLVQEYAAEAETTRNPGLHKQSRSLLDPVALPAPA